MKRFVELEGLRGFLALWVVFGHAFVIARIQPPWPFGRVARPEMAVTVFILLSGFVIAHLLIERRESYLPYITRRFFRLYPVFLAGLVIMLLVFPWRIGGSIGDIPFSPHPSHFENFTALLIANITLLHGLIPGQVLPGAPGAFNTPAWSISLEWQFYLVAPLMLAMLARPKTAIILLVGAAIGSLAFHRGLFGFYSHRSTILGMAPYFIVGMGSRMLVPVLTGQLRHHAPLLIACGVALPPAFLAEPEPFMIWALAVALVAYPDMLATIRVAFANAASRFLGAISYGTYLLHSPLQCLALVLIAAYRPDADRLDVLLVLLVPTTATVILVSWLMHVLVEKPGMQLGATLAARFSDGRPKGVTEAAPS